MGDRLGVPKAERLMRIVETCRDIITAALNLHQSMRAIVEVVTSLTDAYGATISLPEEGLMVCVSASKDLRDRLGTNEPIAASLAGTVYKTGEVEVDKTGDDSVIIVPLREKSRIAGVLSVYSAKSYTFTFEDVAVINLFAEIAGAALEHARTVEESYKESRVDPLTEISNRRAYTERLKVEFSRFHRYNVPFTLMLLDLDDFKRINDHFGHVEGDEVLRRVAQILQTQMRDTDGCFRIGGDEFAVIFSYTDEEHAELPAQRIANSIAATVVGDWNVNASFGLADARKTDDEMQLQARSDASLYDAKRRRKDGKRFLEGAREVTEAETAG